MSAMRLIYGNEKGMVLPLGLMFLAIIAILGTTAVVVTTTDLKIGSNYRASEQAFYAAEAGISEALYRLSLFDDSGVTTPQAPPSGSMITINGLTNNNAAISIDPNGLLSNDSDDDLNGAVDDISDLNSNRNWQTRIMLNTLETGYTDTTTTIYTVTIQPSANWLEYSSSTADGTELTIQYKQDSLDIDGDTDTSEIVFYNEDLTNPLNVDATDATPAGDPASGQPIVVITSTGKSGGSTRKIQVEATCQTINIQAESAVMVNMLPSLGGGLLISGFNYDGTTGPGDENLPPPTNRWLQSVDAVNYPVQAAIVADFRTNDADNYGGDQPDIEDLRPQDPNPPCGAGSPCVTLAGCPSCPHAGSPYSNPQYTLSFTDSNENLLDCGWCDNDCSILDVNKEDWWELEDGIPYGQKLESSSHKPGIWSTMAGVVPGSNTDILGGNRAGTTSWVSQDPTANVWLTLKEFLNVSTETLNEILAGANSTTMDGSGHLTSPFQGIIYIDNAGGNELIVTSSTPYDDDGWGFMYVTGNVHFSAGCYFRGLIYVEGDAECTGSPLFIGCIAVKGDPSGVGAFATGSPHILYSYDALTQYANKGMKFVILSWKEVLS